MLTHLVSLGSLVHLYQMEVQELSFHGLVIDARSTEAHLDGHCSGAVNVVVGFTYGATTGAGTAGSSRARKDRCCRTRSPRSCID